MSLIDKIKNLNRKNKILLGLAVVGFVVLLLLGLFPKRESISKLGSIEIRVTPVRATIHLDQQLHNAKSPTTITGVKPGVHELVVSVNGYYSETLNFDLNPGETKSFDLILEPTQVISTVYVDKRTTSKPGLVDVVGTDEQVLVYLNPLTFLVEFIKGDSAFVIEEEKLKEVTDISWDGASKLVVNTGLDDPNKVDYLVDFTNWSLDTRVDIVELPEVGEHYAWSTGGDLIAFLGDISYLDGTSSLKIYNISENVVIAVGDFRFFAAREVYFVEPNTILLYIFAEGDIRSSDSGLVLVSRDDVNSPWKETKVIVDVRSNPSMSPSHTKFVYFTPKDLVLFDAKTGGSQTIVSRSDFQSPAVHTFLDDETVLTAHVFGGNLIFTEFDLLNNTSKNSAITNVLGAQTLIELRKDDFGNILVNTAEGNTYTFKDF